MSKINFIEFDCKMCNGLKKTTAVTFKGCPNCNENGLNTDLKKNCQCRGQGLIHVRVLNDCLTCDGTGKVKYNKLYAKL